MRGDLTRRRILVAGGRGANGTQSSVLALARATHTRTVSALDVMQRTARTCSAAVYASGWTSSRVYVPNSDSNTVDVIDPHTFKIVDHFAVGEQPQHVAPSCDLKTLYVD